MVSCDARHCLRQEHLVNDDDYVLLLQWSDATKASKLRCISPSSPPLLDFISWLLSRHPNHRPRTAAHLLAHPFIRSHVMCDV